MKRFGKAATLLMVATMLFTSGCRAVNNGETETSVKEAKANPDVNHVSEIDIKNVVNEEENEASDMDADMGYLKFVFDMYGKCAEDNGDENLMVSPTSVMLALDLAAAGANGDTLAQLMSLYGAESNPEAHFRYSADMMESINASEGVEFNVANSIWLNETWLGDGVAPDYLDFVNDVFGANALLEPFGSNTVDDVNGWVDEHTDGMIKKLLDEISPESAAILVNAIAFEAEWAEPYEDYQVEDMDFHGVNGTNEVSMLRGTEDWYFENDDATGFIKYYEGCEYAFLAMLPKDDSISANEFAASMTAESYREFWESKTMEYDVYTRMPEFTSEYSVNMNDVLKDMGVVDAFDEDIADFRGIADLEDMNLYISQVVHKTFIDVNQNGTRAAAATAVIMEVASAIMDEPEIKEVYLDRPFAYAIVDVETGSPIFIGTVNDVEAE